MLLPPMLHDDEFVQCVSPILNELNLVHFETWSSVGILPATTIWQKDVPTTFKNYGSQNRCGL